MKCSRRTITSFAVSVILGLQTLHVPVATAQQGPSQSVPAEKEEQAEPILFPDLHGSDTVFYDHGNRVSQSDREGIEQVLAEHRGAGGEILKIAIVDAPMQGLDAQRTAERMFAEWQKDPELLKEREALLVIFADAGECRIHYSYDLEHLLTGSKGEAIEEAVTGALSRGVGPAAAAGALQLLRALGSPVAEQARVPDAIRQLVAPSAGGASAGLGWALVAVGLLSLLGFGLLLSYQEIHLSSAGAHRIRPHEQLRVLMNSARARMGARGTEGPAEAATGEW